jgi:hypothetical protein
LRGPLGAFDWCVAVESDVDVKVFAGITTILGCPPVTLIATLRGAYLFCRNIVGAPAVSPQNDTKRVRIFALGIAISIRLPCPEY